MSDSTGPDTFKDLEGNMLTPSMVDDHFSGFITGPVTVGAETETGSLYYIVLAPGDPMKLTHAGIDFWVRPGEVTVNGSFIGEYAGFNEKFGCFIVLNRSDSGEFSAIRRSSSLKKILLLAV